MLRSEALDRTARGVGNWALDVYGRWRARRYDVRDTIVVACTGRGGSTWLAQIVSTLPHHHLLWEQLHWRTNPECQDYGFGEPIYLTNERARTEQEQFVRRVLTGQTLSSAINTSRYFQPWDLIRVRAYVAKFVTANMLLPWMVETFGVRTIYMVRHPCAVVASQMKHERWDEVEKEFCEHPVLFQEYPHLRRTFEAINSTEEILAFNWAVQNIIPLKHPNPKPWITTTYEALVEDGMNEVERIFGELGEPVPQRAEPMLNRSSATSSEASSNHRNREQLTKWRKRLSTAQIGRILEVVDDSGIAVYDDGLYPNLDRASVTEKEGKFGGASAE